MSNFGEGGVGSGSFCEFSLQAGNKTTANDRIKKFNGFIKVLYIIIIFDAFSLLIDLT